MIGLSDRLKALETKQHSQKNVPKSLSVQREMRQVQNVGINGVFFLVALWWLKHTSAKSLA